MGEGAEWLKNSAMITICCVLLLNWKPSHFSDATFRWKIFQRGAMYGTAVSLGFCAHRRPLSLVLRASAVVSISLPVLFGWGQITVSQWSGAFWLDNEISCAMPDGMSGEWKWESCTTTAAWASWLLTKRWRKTPCQGSVRAKQISQRKLIQESTLEGTYPSFLCQYSSICKKLLRITVLLRL